MVHSYTDWTTPSLHRILAYFSQDKSTVHSPVHHMFLSSQIPNRQAYSDTYQRLKETGTAVPHNKEHRAQQLITAEECILNYHITVQQPVFEGCLSTWWICTVSMVNYKWFVSLSFATWTHSSAGRLWSSRSTLPVDARASPHSHHTLFIMKYNSTRLEELTVHKIPTCNPPFTLSGLLKAAANINSQRMFGVVQLEICWLDHSFWNI